MLVEKVTFNKEEMMSSHEIHPSEEAYRPIALKQPSFKLGWKKLTDIRISEPEKEALNVSWKGKATKISTKGRDFFADGQNMQLIVEFFSISSQICSIAHSALSHAIPYLHIVSSPFYLYQAVLLAKSRFKLMIQAHRVSQVADVFFWGGKGIEAIGSALGDLVKPLNGGFQLTGLTQVTLIGILFSFVIPIVLMVCGAVGGITQTWALIRTNKVLREFNEKVEGRGDSLEGIAELLIFLQGAQAPLSHGDKEADRLAQAQFELDREHFNENHFSKDVRQGAIRAKISAKLGELKAVKEGIPGVKMVVPLIGKMKEKLSREKDMEEAISLIQRIEKLCGDLLLNEEGAEFKWIDQTATLYGQLKRLLDEEQYLSVWNENNSLRVGLLEDVNKGLEALESLRPEGNEIIDTVRAEIHRQIGKHVIAILLGAMVFTAGVLFLLSSNYQMAATYLSLASGVLTVAAIIFDKKISEERFLQIERYFASLRHKCAIFNLDQPSLEGQVGL